MVVSSPVMLIVQNRIDEPLVRLARPAIDLARTLHISGVELTLILCVITIAAIDGSGEPVTDVAFHA